MNVSTKENFHKYDTEIFNGYIQRVYSDILFNRPSTITELSRPTSIMQRRKKGSRDEYVPIIPINYAKEAYLRDLFINTSFITDSIAQLRNIKIYLTIKNVPDHFLKNNIEEIEYYRHYIEHFHIKFASVVDFILHLVNHSFQLGNPKSKVNFQKITENDWIKNSKVLKQLKKIDKESRPLIEGRHFIVHRGRFQHKSITNIDREIYWKNQENETDLFEDKNRVINETINEFFEQIDKLEYHYSELLVMLIPVIKQQVRIKEITHD